MDNIAVVLLLAVIGFILLPPRFDPAIRWKERNERLKLEEEDKE